MMKIFVRCVTIGVAIWVACWLLPVEHAGAAVMTEEGYELYVPTGVEDGQKHPLVLVLSPLGDTNAMWEVWMPIAQARTWIVMGSTRYSNDRAGQSAAWVTAIKRDLEEVMAKYPVDPRRIVAGGLSGGGSASHMLAHAYPLVISAVIPNTGRIWESLDGAMATYQRGERKRKTHGYKPRMAVFLASPTDFRYEDMKDDRVFLDRAGWRTTWIEFEGGHTLASPEVYEEAAMWLAAQWAR